MLVRRSLAVVAGVAMIVAAILARDGGMEGSERGSSFEREQRAKVAELQQASPAELRRRVEESGGYDLAFDSAYEEVPTLVCSSELGPVCREMARLGFAVIEQPPWTTLSRLRDGSRTDADLWIAPLAVVELGTVASDGALEVEPGAIADARIAAVTRRGEGPAQECASSPTPLSCLVRAGERLTIPDPAASVVGAAVLVAIARESGGTGPDEMATAAELLDGGQATAAPVAELLSVGAPAGEVALDTDAAVVAAFRPGGVPEGEPGPPPVAVRWARTSDSLPVGLAVDPDHPQVDRIRALMRSRSAGYSLDEAGFLDPEDPYVDPEGPLADRPPTPVPMDGRDLEAARAAWQERR